MNGKSRMKRDPPSGVQDVTMSNNVTVPSSGGIKGRMGQGDSGAFRFKLAIQILFLPT